MAAGEGFDEGSSDWGVLGGGLTEGFLGEPSAEGFLGGLPADFFVGLASDFGFLVVSALVFLVVSALVFLVVSALVFLGAPLAEWAEAFLGGTSWLFLASLLAVEFVAAGFVLVLAAGEAYTE